jgi:TP901 family phage tail tape measure protein
VSVNFDAKLSLDISQFLSGVKRAEGALKGLETQIDKINAKSVSPSIQANTAMQSGGSMAQRRAEAAAEQTMTDNIVKRQMAQEQATNSNVRNAARERYALYDVAAAYAAVTAASVTTVKAVVGTAIEYERAFANVVRTSDFTSIKVGEAARVMRFELMQLANEIPVTFGQITEIATIGNQLGIAQGDLVNFTETVAKFAATTDVTIENAAMSFGRIGELLDVGDFNALGSAIAFAGVNAVATETQILAISKEISTTAKQAKFAAPDVIGLATALGSLGIAPEAARGSIIRSFAAINKAISDGGQVLENYASLSGMTADQFASTWQRSGSEAFDALLKGLQAASDSGQNLDSVLRDLGVKNVRDIQTLQKLGDNYDVYAQSIRDANQAFEEGTFLSEAYGVVQETVAAKLGVVQNQLNNLLAGLGESSFGPVKGLLDVISQLLTRLQQLAANPAGQVLGSIVVSSLGVVAAITAINGVIALARASMLAYATAMGTAIENADGLVIGLQKAKTASIILSSALKAIAVFAAITVATAAIAKLGDEIQKATDKAGYLNRRAEELIGGFGGLQDAITEDTVAIRENAAAAGMTVEEYGRLNGLIVINTDAVSGNTDEVDEATRIRQNLALIIGEEPGIIDASTGAIESQTLVIGENTQAWIRNAIANSDAFQKLAENQNAMEVLSRGGYNFNDALIAASGGEAELDAYFKGIINRYKSTVKNISGSGFGFDWEAALNVSGAGTAFNKIKTVLFSAFNRGALLGLGPNLKKPFDDGKESSDEFAKSLSGVSKSLRTVSDYASDLRGVFDRVAEIRLSRQLAQDDVADGWDNIAKRAADAEEAIRNANAEIQELTADRGVLEYQLAVAQRYGDEKRAAVLRARLAKIDDKMAKAQEDLSEAQKDSNKSLTGNTKAARENRSELAGMVDRYQDLIISLVQSGVKGEELEKRIAGLKEEFKQQAIAMGFAESELNPYLTTLTDFAEVAKNMTRRVDVQFNSNISAAQQALREYEAKLKSLNGYTSNQNVRVTYTQPTPLRFIVDPSDIRLYRLGLEKGHLTPQQYYAMVYGITPKQLAALESFWNNAFASGGYVSGPGSGTSDSIPARLSNGEFVMKAQAVRTYGLDFMNSINQMKPIGSMAMGGGASGAIGGVTIAQLSPEDRALLRAAVNRPINLYADSKKIAQTANDGNNLIARRGVR